MNDVGGISIHGVLGLQGETGGGVTYAHIKQKVCPRRRSDHANSVLTCHAVSPDYFCNLDGNGMRLDHLQRPELNKGTVDFAVPEEYWASHAPERLSMPYYSIEPHPTGSRKPAPMNYLFAFDVSHESVQSGFLRTACASLRTVLFGSEDGRIAPCIPRDSKIGILSFDRAIHFYDLSVRFYRPVPEIHVLRPPMQPHLLQVHMMVLPDIDEIFLPLRAGLFVDAIESR